MPRMLVSQQGFSAHWVLWLITLVVVPVTLGLGVWQVGRSDEKRQILADFDNRRNSEPVPFASVRGADPDELAYLPVSITGRVDNEQLIFIANRPHQGERGYHLVSPMELASGLGTVLLDRGWVPAEDYSDELPEIAPVAAEQTVIAEIHVASDKDYIIGDNTLRQGWPRVAQSAEPEYFRQEFRDLYPYLLRVRPGQALSKTANWVVANISPQQHMAYAVQWFAIAAVWLIIFVSLGLKNRSDKKQVEKTE